MNDKFKVALVSVGMLLAYVVPAQADPVSAIAAALISAGIGAATATALATIIVGFVISTAFSLISQALAPSSKQQQAEANMGMNTTLQSGGVVPRSFIVGEYATAGSEFYPARTWGNVNKTPNAYFSRFIALSDLPSSGLTGLIVDGKECTYGSGSPDANLGYAIPEYSSSGSDHLWVKFHDGNQTTVDSYFYSLFAGDPDFPYDSNMIGYGCAYVIVTALINPQLFSSFPQYRFVLQGAKFYDPRADTTVGGSGAQRWATPSTWALTKNPAVVKYNILRGVSWNGQWLFGLQGTDAGRLPLDNWFAAMNVCDNTVTYDGTNNVAQFRCSGEIPVNTSPADVIDELNKADNGRLAENGGIFKIRSGPVGSAVMAFTDADLLVSEPKSFNQFPGLEDAVNGVMAQYNEPDQLWAITDAPSLFDTSLEAEDGGRRLTVSIKYAFVPFGDQVQFMMKSARDESRKFRKHNVVAGPLAVQLEALDVVSWTSVENGYTNKLFTVIPTDQANLDQGLALIEVDPADYDWTPASDYTDFVPIAITSRPVPAQSMISWSATGVQVSGTSGRKVAAIQIGWATSGIDGVDGVQWEIYDNNCPGNLITAGETDAFALGSLTISNNILGETNYQVRGKYRPMYNNRTTNWSSLINVTTPKTQLATNDLQDALLTYGKFAASIKPVQVSAAGVGSSPPFPDVVTEEGAQVVDTNTGLLYTYHAGDWNEVGQGATSFTDLTGTILANQFSTTIRPIEVLGTLPTTGNFDGRMVFLTTDKKVYRFDATNSPGSFTRSVDGADITANSIVAGQITAGAIGTTQLSAQAVTASKLLVSDTSNLILDSNMDDVSYWSSNDSPANTVAQVTPGVSSPADWLTKNAMSFTSRNGTESDCVSQIIQCQPVDQFYVSGQLAIFSGSGTARLRVHFYNRTVSDTAPISTVEIGTTTNHFATNIIGSCTAPALATGLRLEAYINDNAGASPVTIVYFAAPIVKRKGTGQLIVDGSITATKINVGETSNMILDGTCVDPNYWAPWNVATGGAKNFTQTVNSLLDSQNGFIWTNTIADDGLMSDPISVTPGSYLYASCQAYQPTAAGSLQLYICCFNAAGTNTNNYQVQSLATSGSVVRLSGSHQLDSDTVVARLLMYVGSTTSAGIQIMVGSPVMRLMYGGSLIVDGSISASELAAGSVVAGKIAAGAINVDTLIAVNVIVTGHLVDGAVTSSSANSTGSQSIGTFPNPVVWTTTGSVSINTTGSSSNLPTYFTLSGSISSGYTRTVSLRLQLNGSTIWNVDFPIVSGGTVAYSYSGFNAFASAGSNTYTAQIITDDPTGSGVPSTSNSGTLFVATWKK